MPSLTGRDPCCDPPRPCVSTESRTCKRTRQILMYRSSRRSSAPPQPQTSQASLPLFLLFSLLLNSAASSLKETMLSNTCPAPTPPSPHHGDGPVVPTTPLLAFLQRLQSAALQSLGPSPSFDPKLYVDLPLKHDLATTAAAFDALPRHAPADTIPAPDLQRFVRDYFGDAGDDLDTVDPADFVAEPQGFLPRVDHPEVRAWALQVHALWKDLCRKVGGSVADHPDRHTLLPLPEHVVVPGSRFREVYYWDSYWIVRGLLVSKMYDTAKGVIKNLISMIDAYGHVLNGARAYYSNRSQPPLLSSMVVELYRRTGDVMFVEKALPSLVREHKFWNSGVHKVIIKDAHGRKHSVSRYYAMWNKPRPETATIDEESSVKILNPLLKEKFYRELATTAESGWDFSSRWMSNSSDLTTLSTTSVLPADLNAFILKMELDIAYLAKIVGDRSTSSVFEVASSKRLSVFNSVFWNPQMEQWLDYWVPDHPHCQYVHQWNANCQSTKVFASNFVPVWIQILSSDNIMMEKIVKSLLKSGLLQANGIATSLSKTGQQWDFPNGWAPLQHLIAEGLARSGSENARRLAEDIALRWIRTNYAAYKKTGAMHEKYDVEKWGSSGGGGEYKPQTGFGWTNGVVLAMLEEFGWPRDREINCSS